MVQLNLYLRELSDFLRTVTINDTIVADNMFAAWVNDEYKELVENDMTVHPYYRNLLGHYIVFDHSYLRPVIEQLYDQKILFNTPPTGDKDTIIKKVLYTLFPLETEVTIFDSYGMSYKRKIPNRKLYKYCNEVPIISSYDTPTQTRIPFIREFLYHTGTSDALDIRIHSSTSVVYRIPNERYNTLTSKYRASSSIIRSIVYPVTVDISDTSSITTAQLERLRLEKILNADNITALAYDASLLELSEQQSLLDCMNETLSMIRRRYAVRELGYENLYAPAHYYIIWQILYLALFVQRISNIKSGDAHTYHIWNYLKSHGFEDYRDVLSVLQQKFLYKNLPYLLKHKGTEHAFEILNYVFFNTENISLYGKNTMQSTVENRYVDEDKQVFTSDTTKKYPDVRSIRIAKPLLDGISNIKKTSSRFEDVLTYMGKNAGVVTLNDPQEYAYGTREELDELYQKERAEGLEYQDDNLFERSTETQTTLLSHSPVSHRNTKLLELRNNNTVDDYYGIYSRFIAETILYRISKNNFRFSMSLQLPNSTKWVTLPVQEWIAMMFYALDRTNFSTNKIVIQSSPYERVKIKNVREDGTIQYYFTWKAFDKDKNLVEKTRKLYDRPPKYAGIAYPYTLDGDWELPEYFYWNGIKRRLDLNLADLATDYSFNTVSVENGQTKYTPIYRFYLADDSVKLSNLTRHWKTTDGIVLRYNHKRSWWNIVDKDENLLFYSSKTVVDTANLSYLTWFTPDHQSVRNVLRIEKGGYLVDTLMPQYNTLITSQGQCASLLHDQGLGFLLMHIAANQDESAVHREAYHTVLQQRCVEGVIGDLDLLDGKTYEEYFLHGNADVQVLRQLLDYYDNSEDIVALYSMMADTIIAAMLPPDDPFLAKHAKTDEFKFSKLVQLFKSMTAYNLSYLGINYEDVDSTKLTVNSSDFSHLDINVRIVDDCNTMTDEVYMKVMPVYRPADMDLDHNIRFTFTLSDDPDTDEEYKLKLLNNIDAIVQIVTARRTSKAKKKTKLLALLPEELVEIISTYSVAFLQNLQDAVHRVREDNTSVHTRTSDTDLDLFKVEISDITIN